MLETRRSFFAIVALLALLSAPATFAADTMRAADFVDEVVEFIENLFQGADAYVANQQADDELNPVVIPEG